ncbi:MAG: zinc ribbon domain-containing protein [Phycisphaerales bacterium]|nr:zinc ribbon domain-containing protein [Phycisphaerales bacterium]
MIDEGPTQEDIDHFSKKDIGYCPECGEEIWDEAPQCVACGSWLADGAARRHPAEATFRKQSFAIIGIIVLVAFFWSLWRFF